MPIPNHLLEILACTLCKKPVRLLPDGSGLICDACKRVYPVRDGIPGMLLEDAKIASE